MCEAGVADRADMRPAIAEAEDGVGPPHHFEGRIERALRIVEHGEVEHALAATLQHVVEREFCRRNAATLRSGGDRVFHQRLVVGWVSQQEHLAEVGEVEAREAIIAFGLAGKQAGAEFRIAQRGDLWSSGRCAISRNAAWAEKGLWVSSSPNSSPTGRPQTWARISRPSALAHRSGRGSSARRPARGRPGPARSTAAGRTSRPCGGAWPSPACGP